MDGLLQAAQLGRVDQGNIRAAAAVNEHGLCIGGNTIHQAGEVGSCLGV